MPVDVRVVPKHNSTSDYTPPRPKGAEGPSIRSENLSFDPVPWIERSRPFSTWQLHAPMPDLSESPSKRVCVIGGGIAGLVAAYELRKLGHDVTLLEATNRCGGRMLTHRFDANHYGEFGAMRIPVDHLCTWKYIQEFSLQPYTFVQDNADAYYHLRGKRFRQEPWQPLQVAHPGLYPAVRPHIGDPAPGDVLERWIQQLTDKLPTSDELWDAFSPSLNSWRLRYFDRFSVWQHMQGILPPSRGSFPWTLLASALAGRFLNDEEWEYVGRSTSMLWDEKISYLEALVDTVPHYYPFMATIAGGLERLAEALQISLTNEIQLDSPVTEIALEKSGVRVSWNRQGQSHEAQFQYVISAVPAGATVAIQFDPPLPAAKYEALTNLSYQSAAKSLVLCNTRRWEWSDAIFGGCSHTDMEIQECWYPSDNAIRNPNPESQPSSKLIYYPDGTRVEIPVTKEWLAKDPSVSQGPGVLLAAYMWGTNARRFASLTRDQRDALVLTCLERLHPGIRGDIVEIEHWSWDTHSNPGGGAWASFRPGERGRYQAALVAPYPSGEASSSQVFFAGEHLGISHAWIQSAIQTAQGAVWHVHYA